MTQNPEHRRIEFLDHLRIFAFVSVLVGHKMYPELAALSADASLHASFRLLAQVALPFCAGGAAGVMVFFLISGYIIAHVLRAERPGQFVVKRVFRIYPLYVTAVLAEALLGRMIGSHPFPPLSVMLPRLLLLGDFFDVPYALWGVEWTLRVEIVFYVFMAVLKMTGLFDRTRLLPFVLALAVIALHVAAPFPDFPGASKGYFTIYGPILFAGVAFYLMERGLADRRACVGLIVLTVLVFLLLIQTFQPHWKESHYGVLAVALFAIAWAARTRLRAGPAIRLLSDLTYSVYLFHNWLWPYLETLLGVPGATGFGAKLRVAALLFVICYALHRTVEQGGIRLGRRVLFRAGTGAPLPKAAGAA